MRVFGRDKEEELQRPMKKLLWIMCVFTNLIAVMVSYIYMYIYKNIYIVVISLSFVSAIITGIVCIRVIFAS